MSGPQLDHECEYRERFTNQMQAATELIAKLDDAERRLAAVEKLPQMILNSVDPVQSGVDVRLQCVALVRAALGAAVTPTLQDDETETLDDELRGLAGTWANDPHLDRNTAIQCANDMGSVLDRYLPVTSTPEAATGAPLVSLDTIWACIDARHDVGQRHDDDGHLGTATCHDCRTHYDRHWSPGTPSELQRATEQQQ